jgi:hypothetical protein
MSTKSRRLGACAVSVLAVGLLGLPSAAAAKAQCVGNDAGAYVCFEGRGDKFTVRDTSDNDMSAAVVWRTSYGREGTCRNSRGKGTVVTCNYDMAEARTVAFWAVDIDVPTNRYKNWSADETGFT